MKATKDIKKAEQLISREEKSGLLNFLSSVTSEVRKFNEVYGFDIEDLPASLLEIDGDFDIPLQTKFILERKNLMVPEFRYCLYALLKDHVLYGYVGLYRNGSITTVKELGPMWDFENGQVTLFEWLKQLVRTSFEKRVL